MFLIVRLTKDNELFLHAHAPSPITKICARELFFIKERVYFVQKCSDDYVHPFHSTTFMPFKSGSTVLLIILPAPSTTFLHAENRNGYTRSLTWLAMRSSNDQDEML
jgi:hypothetical protein